VVENIHQGEVYCVCVSYYVRRGYVRTWSCIRCRHGTSSVGFEHDPKASYIMRVAPHVVTHDDLIAVGAQGEPSYVPIQCGRCCGIRGEEHL
jgi:hypothetical protein